MKCDYLYSIKRVSGVNFIIVHDTYMEMTVGKMIESITKIENISGAHHILVYTPSESDNWTSFSIAQNTKIASNCNSLEEVIKTTCEVMIEYSVL